MLNVEVKLAGKNITGLFTSMEKQITYATAKASNNIAFYVMKKEKEEIKRVFKNPKPSTVRSIRVLKANSVNKNTTAKILFDSIHHDADEYMLPNVVGGGRKKKRSEKRLGHYYVPTKFADKDRYGNMRGGQVTKILSQAKLFNEAGYDANVTAKSKRRRKKRETYVLFDQAQGKRKAGVYKRSDKHFNIATKQQALVPIILFTKQPRYKRRFHFYRLAEKIVDKKWEKQFSYWMDKAFKTSAANLTKF